jgi:aspartate/methionine/tyrosine aminotransferase
VRNIIREAAGLADHRRPGARNGDPPVIPLWSSQGDLPTPAFISTAATAAPQAGHTFYAHKAGLPELLAAGITDYLTGRHPHPIVVAPQIREGSFVKSGAWA